MLAIRLDPKLEARVAALAKASRKTKSEIIREAVLRLLEDTEDLELAERSIAAMKSTKSLTKLRKELGLDR
jgi:RHH-type rel operon transcriptional repressor/antitoxin RelB